MNESSTISPLAGDVSFAPSNYNISSDIVGKNIAVFNTLTQNLLVLNLEEYSALSVGRDIAGQFAKLGLLKQHDVDEFALAMETRRRWRSETDDSLHVVITPTLACNFSCSYCYNGIRHKIGNPGKVIDFSAKYISDNLQNQGDLQVTWYGGEPILCMEEIEAGTNKITYIVREKCGRYSSEFVTNGSLLTPSIGLAMKRCHILRVQISIDWPLDLSQRTTNPTKKNESLTRSLVGLTHVPDDIDVVLRINIFPGFLDTFEQLIAHIRSIVDRKFAIYVQRIGFSNDISLNASISDNLRYDDVHAFYDELLRAKEILRSNGFPQPYYPASFRKNICIAQRPHDVVIGPNAEIRKCTREVEGLGAVVSVDSKQSNSQAIFYQNNEVTSDSVCGQCKYLPICFGGCVKERYERPDELAYRCDPFKYTLEKELTLFLQRKTRMEN